MRTLVGAVEPEPRPGPAVYVQPWLYPVRDDTVPLSGIPMFTTGAYTAIVPSYPWPVTSSAAAPSTLTVSWP